MEPATEESKPLELPLEAAERSAGKGKCFLPGLNGWEATEVLKRKPQTRNLRVMMLTGHVFKDSKKRAEASGVDLFVAKPCLPDDLYSHILALAGWPSGTRHARSAARDAATKRARKKPTHH